MLENTLKEIALKKNICHTNLRISNVYGIGINHGFMPIVVKVVLPENFLTWIYSRVNF